MYSPRSVMTALAPILAVPALLLAQQQSPEFRAADRGPVWTVKATDPYLIGGYGDNFAYDGKRVKKLEGGVAYMSINAEANKGWILATFKGTVSPAKGKTYTGKFTFFYPMFMAKGPEYWEGGVADYRVLHGNTGQEAPVMPATPSYLATWGPSMIMVNGERIFMGPGHTMLTEETRDPKTMAIYADEAHTKPYSPMNPAHGVMYDPNAMELHLVAHSDDRDEGNFPKFGLFLHLNFQTVELDAEIPAEVRQKAETMQEQAMAMMKQKRGE